MELSTLATDGLLMLAFTSSPWVLLATRSRLVTLTTMSRYGLLVLTYSNGVITSYVMMRVNPNRKMESGKSNTTTPR